MKKTISCLVFSLCILSTLVIVTALIFECAGYNNAEYNIGIFGADIFQLIPYLVLILLCCAFFLIYEHGHGKVIKTVFGILSLLCICFLCVALFFRLLFGNFGENAVVKTVESPNKEYYAEVIDSDQGALGGNTFVDVYEKSIIKTPILTVCKKPKRIYSGKWGEYKKMQIYWKDDTCLVINSVEYKITR